MQNKILDLQNEEPQIKLLRARTRTYTIANRFMISQIFLTVLAPVVGAIWGAIDAQARPYFGLLAIIVLLIDPWWISRQYAKNLKRAAKISEKFDCIVLNIDWNSFVVGESVEVEHIHRLAKKYKSKYDDSKLLDWYPKSAGELPLHFGRLVCQRTNLRYDRELRRHYALILASSVIFVVLFVISLGFKQHLTLDEWVINLAILSPLLSWSIREIFRQRDTADRQHALMKSAEKLWNQCLEEVIAEDEANFKAREFQDAIYALRVSRPLILPLVYKFFRAELEDEMNEAANGFLTQYLQSSAAKNNIRSDKHSTSCDD